MFWLLAIWLFPLVFPTENFAEQTPTMESSTVRLDRPVFFASPDGEPLEIRKGSYTLESADPGLRLVAGARRDAILIEALTTEHEEAIETPVGIAMETADGYLHLLLLLPGGKGLEAIGSADGIQARGLLRKKLSLGQIKQGYTAKPLIAVSPFQASQPSQPGLTARPNISVAPQVQIQGSPPVPILDRPTPDYSLNNPQLSFRWHPSSANPDQTRYELCVTEMGTMCGSSAASVVFKTMEAAAEAGTAQYELGVGPLAGQSSPSTETPITAPQYDVTLPIRFQGKRLQWSIKACAPNPDKPVFAGGTAESCSQSRPRNLLWPLPQPVLNTPSNGPLLDLKPMFSWNYGDTHGLDHFLLCIAKPGVSCGHTPSTQPHVFVVKIQESTQFTFPPGSAPPIPPDLSPFMGQTLHWTVAACNRAFGCRYQERYGILHITPQAGTFAPLYPVTQHPKCTNCHGLDNNNAKFHQHVQEGRFPADTDFSYFSPQPICQSCHTRERGFENGWRAPRRGLDFTGDSLPQVCRQVKFDGAAGYFLPDFEPAREHLKTDKLILWAIHRIPGMNMTKWHGLVDAWIDAGAPCPCEPGKCRFREHPYGQFTR